jgi:hypothetical protein
MKIGRIESSLRKILLICIIVLGGLGSAIGFWGLRLVVFAPVGDQPGKMILATGLRELNVIDSPQAYCFRQGDSDPTCPISFGVAIAHEGTVLAELPYVEALQKMTVPSAP